MPTTVDSKGVTSGYADHEDGWTASMNANLRRLSAMGAEGFAADTEAMHLLSYHYRGGMVPSGNGFSLVAGGSVDLTDNTTNYVERTGPGVVSANTVGFSGGLFPMAIVVTLAGVITTITDRRPSSIGADPDALVSRSDIEFTTANILKDATTTGTVDIGATSLPVRFVVDHQCWYRFYATAADRTADAGRVITDDPTTPVLLEMILTTDLSLELDPNWPMVNRDVPPLNVVYYACTRLDQSFGVMTDYASDLPTTNGNLIAHAPTTPKASGWTAWQYTAADTAYVTKDFGAILAVNDPVVPARSNVNFQHEELIRLLSSTTRLAVDVVSSAGFLGLFVDDEDIGTWDGNDLLLGGIVRSSNTDVAVQIVDVAPSGDKTVLDTHLTLPWALNATKLMWFERDGTDVVLYLSDTNFAARVEYCRAAIPSRLLTIKDRRVGLYGVSNGGASGGFGMTIDVSGNPRQASPIVATLTRVKVEAVAE